MEISVRPGPDDVAISLLLGERGAERLSAPTVLGHWLAYRNDAPIGLAYAFRRADDRIFVVHRGDDDAAFHPLLAAACREIDEALNVTMDATAPGRRSAAVAEGFDVELEATAYDVPFTSALAALAPLRPSSHLIRRADQVNADALYRLDVTLRNDVPGTDGWRGDRAAFDDELNSPEVDASGYVVAQSGEGSLVGLCRLWRNDPQPSLGLLGVVPDHRNGLVAASLLREALAAASTWGSATFGTHTARPALQRRLLRLGATETGGFVRLRRLGR